MCDIIMFEVAKHDYIIVWMNGLHQNLSVILRYNISVFSGPQNCLSCFADNISNCRTPDWQSSPVQLLIGKSGRLYIRVVVCLVGWLYVTVATVLMLLWPWKMLKLSVGPSVGTDCFCNVLDWTGLDWTLLAPWLTFLTPC